MPTGGRLQVIKGVLYRLKRSYGCPLSVYRQCPQEIDFATGVSSIVRTSVDINQAIVLPSNMHRGVSHKSSYVRAQPNFNYGGVYTDGDRQIIIDRKDLPNDWILNATDQWYIVYQGKRYELKAVDEYEFNYGYLITMTRLDGAIVDQNVNIRILDRLCYSEILDVTSPELVMQTQIDAFAFDEAVTYTISNLDNLEIMILPDSLAFDC